MPNAVVIEIAAAALTLMQRMKSMATEVLLYERDGLGPVQVVVQVI